MASKRPNKIVVAVRLNRSEIVRMDRLKDDVGYTSRGEFSKNIILRAFDCIDEVGYPEFLRRFSNVNTCTCGATR